MGIAAGGRVYILQVAVALLPSSPFLASPLHNFPVDFLLFSCRMGARGTLSVSWLLLRRLIVHVIAGGMRVGFDTVSRSSACLLAPRALSIVGDRS